MKEEIDIFFVLEPTSYIALDRFCGSPDLDFILFLRKRAVLVHKAI
jgi:hypothetical protein